MRRAILIFMLWMPLGLTVGCSDAPLEYTNVPPSEDLVPYEPEPGKADGYGFDHNHLVDDAVFEDVVGPVQQYSLFSTYFHVFSLIQ